MLLTEKSSLDFSFGGATEGVYSISRLGFEFLYRGVHSGFSRDSFLICERAVFGRSNDCFTALGDLLFWDEIAEVTKSLSCFESKVPLFDYTTII